MINDCPFVTACMWWINHKTESDCFRHHNWPIALDVWHEGQKKFHKNKPPPRLSKKQRIFDHFPHPATTHNNIQWLLFACTQRRPIRCIQQWGIYFYFLAANKEEKWPHDLKNYEDTQPTKSTKNKSAQTLKTLFRLTFLHWLGCSARRNDFFVDFKKTCRNNVLGVFFFASPFSNLPSRKIPELDHLAIPTFKKQIWRL